MKTRIGLFAIAAMAACSFGCATTRLHAQIDALQAENDRQQKEVQDLSARAADMSASAARCHTFDTAHDLASDGIDMATSVWNWLETKTTQVQDSDTYRATRARVSACYDDGKTNVHDLDSAKALALRCYDGVNK